MQRWGSFPLLAANYTFDRADNPKNTEIGNLLTPFTTFNEGGLKIGVIGMGNLSSLSSIFDQPNGLGIRALNTVETAQFYIDLLRPSVDVIIMLTHLGLDVDERMIRQTTGIDVVLGGHNHIVIDPPQELQDCSADPNNPGYVWVVNPNIEFDPSNPVYDPVDTLHQHPNQIPRHCRPRKVILSHSGAFAKYVGRLDLVLSNDPKTASPTGDPNDYDLKNGFEVVSSKYIPYPIDDSIPSDPVMVDMLQPYARTLDRAADLSIIVGFAPQLVKRIAPQGGDSPLGNLISTAMWLRLGVQTDFSMTNSTGIRTDLIQGPVTVEEMYNIFPFDNTITKMQLSGVEVQEMFDFIARRSSQRSCQSQAQIAGVRVRLNCAGCTTQNVVTTCNTDNDCLTQGLGNCDTSKHVCAVIACAEHIYIGHTALVCQNDSDCPKDPNGNVQEGICDLSLTYDPDPTKNRRVCQSPIQITNLYELATSNYLAGGGSGFRVLQRNTTQLDTKIQQRDALIDFIRAGRPCGYRAAPDRPDGLASCATDADCTGEGDFVCACTGHAHLDTSTGVQACITDNSCDPAVGRCVRRDCRDGIAQFHNKACADSPSQSNCQTDLQACELAGEECKVVACVDDSLGATSDNRVEMLGR
jgi:5'-nucleotidase